MGLDDPFVSQNSREIYTSHFQRRILICTYYYHLLLERFSHRFKLIVFHWSLSDRKSPQISRTLLSILAALNNSEVWMISIRPLTSKSSSPFNNLLIVIIIIVITFSVFHISISWWFFTGLSDSKYSQVCRTFLSILMNIVIAVA